MAKGDKPVQRIKLKRKDGQDGKGINRDGSPYTAKHVEYGTVWQNPGGKSVQLAPGFIIATKDAKGKLTEYPECFINVFEADDRGKREAAGAADDDF